MAVFECWQAYRPDNVNNCLNWLLLGLVIASWAIWFAVKYKKHADDLHKTLDFLDFARSEDDETNTN